MPKGVQHNMISVRCKSCQHTMKFAASKAGKKARCPKCDALIVIEAEEEKIQLVDDDAPVQLVDDPPAEQAAETPAPPAEPPPAAPPEPPKHDEFSDDGPSSYGVYVDPELEERQKAMQAEEESKKKKKKDKKKLPKVTRKVKAIDQAEEWTKVRAGLMWLFVGVCIWMFTHLLSGLYVLLGSVELSEYANVIATNLEERRGDDFPPPGRFWDVDQFDIYLTMIAGGKFAGLAQFCITTAALFYFLQALIWGLGYLFCLPVPRRFGMFGQLLMMIGLLIFNVVITFIFKLLPVLGIGYIMIPYLVPEIAMTEYNMDRQMPLNVLWSGSPFLENLGSLIFKFAFYLEPTFACIFLWSIGVAIKEEDLANSGKSLTQMSLGTLFILGAFQLLSVCGATPVLVGLLRILYTLWFFFLLGFMLQYALLLVRCRAVLEEKIHPTNEAVSDEE